MIETIDIVTRLVAGAGMGMAIGLERQWRARTAGVRTNALVAVGATLFVIMGASSFHGSGADPTRVAAQVVSGIGFLGAGVIMKQGASISGLNTAATLWASAAVGTLAGGGLLWVALAGTGVVIAANVLLRPLARALDGWHGIAGRESGAPAEYTFEVRCSRSDEVGVRAMVFAAVHRPDLTVRSLAATDLPEGIVVITATAVSPRRDDHRVEMALAEVIPHPQVLGVRWSVEDLADCD